MEAGTEISGELMVSKCANPRCSAVLHRLRDGRLFAFELRSEPEAVTHRHQYHWLCTECTKTLTLRCKDGSEVVVVTRKKGASAPSLLPLTAITA